MKELFSTLAFRCVFAIVLMDSFGAIAQGTWTKKTDLPASSRYHGLGFSMGTKGYFGMGQKQTKPFVYKIYNDLWEYDSEKDTWTQKSDFPGEGRLGAKGFLINGKIYIGFGYVIAAYGPNAGSKDYKIDLYEFDPYVNRWSKKNDSYLADQDICFVIKNTMYAVDIEYRILKRYKPLTDTWTESKWEKKAIAPHYVDIIGKNIDFSIGEKEYIITTIRKKGKYINQLWELDPLTITWNKKNDLPVPGSDTLNAFSIGKRGYVMRRSTDFLEYDPTSDTWSPKKGNSADNDFSHSFIIGGRSYGFIKHKFWEFIP